MEENDEDYSPKKRVIYKFDEASDMEGKLKQLSQQKDIIESGQHIEMRKSTIRRPEEVKFRTLEEERAN